MYIRIWIVAVVLNLPVYLSAQTIKDSSYKNVFTDIKRIALNAKESGRRGLADSLALVYKNDYLDTLNEKEFLRKENFEFITQYPELINSRDRFFLFFYDSANSAFKTGNIKNNYAIGLVKYIISKEEADPYLLKSDGASHSKIPWRSIQKNIAHKYGDRYAVEIIMSANYFYYKKISDWKKFANCLDKMIAYYAPTSSSNFLGGTFGDSWTLNSIAWDVFLNCNQKSILRKAVGWASLSISLAEKEPYVYQILDTKANIYYKMGNYHDAILVEEKALTLNADSKALRSTLSKMKEGIPTWPVSK
jgi:hypothetical protein